MTKFEKTYCSQCGGEFGPGDHGFSHCDQHAVPAQRSPLAATEGFRVVPVRVLQSAYDRIDAMLANSEPDLRETNSVRIELRHLINETYVVAPAEISTTSEPSHVAIVGWPTIKRLAAGESVWIEELQWGAVAASDLIGADIDAIASHSPAASDTVWSAEVHDKIIKRLMANVGMPNSTSVYTAFKQFANELHALATAAGRSQPGCSEIDDLKKANQILHGLANNRDAEIERLRAELRKIADFDTYWTSAHYDDGKTEIIERSATGNIRVRGHWGKRALVALSSTLRQEGE